MDSNNNNNPSSKARSNTPRGTGDMLQHQASFNIKPDI
jgi:hypothetical protein